MIVSKYYLFPITIWCLRLKHMDYGMYNGSKKNTIFDFEQKCPYLRSWERIRLWILKTSLVRGKS